MVTQRSLFLSECSSLCCLSSTGATVVISGAGTVDKMESQAMVAPDDGAVLIGKVGGETTSTSAVAASSISFPSYTAEFLGDDPLRWLAPVSRTKVSVRRSTQLAVL